MQYRGTTPSSANSPRRDDSDTRSAHRNPVATLTRPAATDRRDKEWCEGRVANIHLWSRHPQPATYDRADGSSGRLGPVESLDAAGRTEELEARLSGACPDLTLHPHGRGPVAGVATAGRAASADRQAAGQDAVRHALRRRAECPVGRVPLPKGPRSKLRRHDHGRRGSRAITGAGVACRRHSAQ
jgi:hypothetical protein